VQVSGFDYLLTKCIGVISLCAKCSSWWGCYGRNNRNVNFSVLIPLENFIGQKRREIHPEIEVWESQTKRCTNRVGPEMRMRDIMPEVQYKPAIKHAGT